MKYVIINSAIAIVIATVLSYLCHLSAVEGFGIYFLSSIGLTLNDISDHLRDGR